MRRACSAVVAGMLLSASALPAALLAGMPSADASTSQATGTASKHLPGSGAVPITITGISPRTAVLGKTITISGTVTNRSRQTLVNTKVQFLVSPAPVSDMQTLMTDVATDLPVGTVAIPGRATQPATQIPPGSSSSWSIAFPASRLGFTTFGAYPVTAALSESGTTLSDTNSFLPYTPPKRGHSASPSPRPQQIAWVLPLIDQPLTGIPGTRQCQSAQAGTLAASMVKTGRLNGLLGAGMTKYARADKITWAVDPALVWDAAELGSARCDAVNARNADAASAWLRELRAATSGQPLFTTPYANVSLALVSQGQEPDVTNALLDGRSVAQRYLNPDLTPKVPVPGTTTQQQTAGTLWPPQGVASQFTVQPLAAHAGISTVLLSDKVVTGARATASEVPNLVGGYVRIVLYNADLSQLLARVEAAPSDQFGKEQAFLAATAVLAGQPGSQPILVAPPQLWQASGRFAADLLAETASASWLDPVSVSTIAAAAHPGNLGLPRTGAEKPGFSRGVLRGLKSLAYNIKQLSSLDAGNSPNDLQLALYTVESASLRLRRPEQIRMINKLNNSVTYQLKQVGLGIKGPVFLGGLKGNVPLIIDNQLSFPVKVRIVSSVREPPPGGFTVQGPAGLITVPPKDKFPTSLHVQATQAGAATITLHLVNDRNQGLPGPQVSVTVHATQFGTLAMIILASALGVFVIASAARGLRRRPPSPDNPAEDGHPGADDAQGGEITAEPDTVLAEHSELGAAGRSGLR